MSPSVPLDGASKPIHTIVLDSSPLILNTPGISTLLANGHVLATTPSVLAELKNEEAKSRVETLYRPFLELQSPKPESVAFVRAFARKTGDAGVLSQTDFEVLALAYDLECERNGGDWRLRNAPGQKRLNGSRPEKAGGNDEAAKDEASEERAATLKATEDRGNSRSRVENNKINKINRVKNSRVRNSRVKNSRVKNSRVKINKNRRKINKNRVKINKNNRVKINKNNRVKINKNNRVKINKNSVKMNKIYKINREPDSADSDDGWITPSNIKRRQAQDEAANMAANARGPAKMLQVATMTGDFAMQNVLLQINLNLLSTKTCQRISQIKQFVLRCHACFATCKDMSKQFCPRCGKPTLTRVSCTTNDKGEVKLHLKANMQWNNRGNVYSIPKPVTGSANQKWKGPTQGGGRGGWGSDLILAEDQKEYIRAISSAKRSKAKDLMDEDTLPNILTGERDRARGRPRVGAGRNVNSRKR
ncbi:hypothetical protein DV737_g1401, partial [Chaetothyriales sp. CBS 132003]